MAEEQQRRACAECGGDVKQKVLDLIHVNVWGIILCRLHALEMCWYDSGPEN